MKFGDVQARVALFAVSFLAMLWGYHLMFLHDAPAAFQSAKEDLSYGWYVPLFSLYVLWTERKQIIASVGSPSLWGLFWLVPFLFLGFLGIRGWQVRLEIVGFVGALVCLVWTSFGAETMRRILFPVLFLLFCMPMDSALGMITVPLRMLAVTISEGVLQGCGIEVARTGTTLVSPTGIFAIDVASPCSGLRSLFALTTLTAGYAYFTQPTWLRRGLLFACAVPIAIAGNVVRILSIALVAVTCSAEFATGFYHDYSGYIVFLASIFLMAGAGSLITKGAERCANS